MGKVVYRGAANEKILSAADLKKAGVEGFTQKTFRPNDVLEVDQDIVDALVSRPDLFGVGFSEVVDVPVDEADPARAIEPSGEDVEPVTPAAASRRRSTSTT